MSLIIPTSSHISVTYYVCYCTGQSRHYDTMHNVDFTTTVGKQVELGSFFTAQYMCLYLVDRLKWHYTVHSRMYDWSTEWTGVLYGSPSWTELLLAILFDLSHFKLPMQITNYTASSYKIVTIVINSVLRRTIKAKIIVI